MWVTYSVLCYFPCKLATSFSTFSIFILASKNGKLLKVHVIFQDIEHQLRENILHHFLHYIIYELYVILNSIFYPLKIIHQKLLQHCPNIYLIYISILNIWGFFIFIIIFHLFVISSCINRVTCSSSYTFFYH